MAVTGRKLQKNSSKLNSIFRFGSSKIKGIFFYKRCKQNHSGQNVLWFLVSPHLKD